MDYCIYDRFEDCHHDCDGCPKADNQSEYEYYKDYLYQVYCENFREVESRHKS